MVIELLKIIIEGLSVISSAKLIIVFVSAFIFAVISWWACLNYTRLWNKRFESNTGHKFLCLITSLLSFSMIFAFVGINHIKMVASHTVSLWANELSKSPSWNDYVFKKSYRILKESGREDFANVPAPDQPDSYLPFSEMGSVALAAEIYATEACDDFIRRHRLLSGFMATRPKLSQSVILSDMKSYFSSGEKVYPMDRAVRLAAAQIKVELMKQLPRILKISRLLLFVVFFLLQLIPLGIVGYYGYKKININKKV